MKLVGKASLLISGLLLMIREFYSEYLVAVFLTVTVLSCLIYYFDHAKVTAFAAILYSIVSIVNPPACVFLPLVYYDLLWERLWLVSVISAVPLVQFYQLTGLWNLAFVLILIFIAFVLQYSCKKSDELHSKLIQIFDASKELNITLQKKNEYLVQKQDYEVHVATLGERNRIAREIHDSVGHLLSRAILQIGAVMAINHQEQLSGQLTDLKSTLSLSMDSIRSSVHDLRDTTVDLQHAVNTMIENFPAYQIDLDYDMGENIPVKIKYCFIAVLKEALVNITKHSNADRVKIVVREHPALYQLLVEDNGTQIKSIQEGGIGLESMRDRTHSLGGNLNIDIQNGFSVFISIPQNTTE